MRHIIIVILILTNLFIMVSCCSDDETPITEKLIFNNPTPVEILGLPIGFNSTPLSIEEPFISRDGQYLLFNSGEHEGGKDVYFAKLINSDWVFQGAPANNMNTSNEVQGVPTMDENNTFFYIDTEVEHMVRKADFLPSQNKITNIVEFTDIMKKEIDTTNNRFYGNMGVELSKDGTCLYFSRASWDINLSIPALGDMRTSDILFLEKVGDSYVYNETKVNNIMQNINTENLEYAACISADGLRFFFTRFLIADYQASIFRSRIMQSTRNSLSEPFGIPTIVETIGTEDFVEAPAITPDEKELYYHKKDGIKFKLFKVTR